MFDQIGGAVAQRLRLDQVLGSLVASGRRKGLVDPWWPLGAGVTHLPDKVRIGPHTYEIRIDDES